MTGKTVLVTGSTSGLAPDLVRHMAGAVRREFPGADANAGDGFKRSDTSRTRAA